MRHKAHIHVNHGELPESASSGWYARRALLRSAVFDTRHRELELWAYRAATATSVVSGVIADVREDAIVLDSQYGPESFAISPGTVIWLGAQTAPSALRRGDEAIIRYRVPDDDTPGHRVAERIWARIGRVTGTIVATDEREIHVDTGREGPPQRVVVAPAALRQIQVRFPRLAPGFLFDVIGTRHGDHLLAVTPATAQPPYHAGHLPAPPKVSGPVSVPVSGSAVWHDPDDEQPDLLGLAYPALDPETDGRQPDGHPGCVRLPYLSLGSAVSVRNECADRALVLPVTSDGASARQFCDRCVNCGTSPKGRVADLTRTAFAELGGNLEDGCFNATISLLD